MAIDLFHTQISSASTPVQDLVLKLGMRSLSREITWAHLRPEQWTDLVCNGDEIRLGSSGAEGVDLYDPTLLITFKRYTGYDTYTKQPGYKYLTIPPPTTCEVRSVQIREKGRLG